MKLHYFHFPNKILSIQTIVNNIPNCLQINCSCLEKKKSFTALSLFIFHPDIILFLFSKFPDAYPLHGLIKGTVKVISSDTPFIDGNARFKTVPMKPLSNQY